MTKVFFLILSVMFVMINSAAANLSVSVDKTSVPLGGIIVLNIKSDQKLNDSPDLSVLSRDFKVFSTSMSHQQYVANGKRESTTEWQIGLIPLNPGVQKIPAIKIGHEKTEPLTIMVADSQLNLPRNAMDNQKNLSEDIADNDGSPYRLDATIANPHRQYYVQQQIIYEVVLTDSGGLQGGEPTFNARADEWIIKSMGQPQIQVQNQGNIKIRRIVFKYALFPQRSGALTIPEVYFNGFAIQQNATTPPQVINAGIFNISFDMPSLFGNEVPVSLRVPAKKINVLPVPNEFTGKWWLPAEKVILRSDGLIVPQNLTIGDAISRKVTLEAVGVIDTQLPEINFQTAEGFKQYPEKSIKKNAIVDGKLTAVQESVNVYIPEKSGNLILPEIVVPWFNTLTGKMEVARLPAQAIFVKQGANITTDNDPEKLLSEAEKSLQKNISRSQSLAQNDQPSPKNTQNFSQEKKLQTGSMGQNTSVKTNFQKLKKFFRPWIIYLLIISAFIGGVVVSSLYFLRRDNSKKKTLFETKPYPDYIIQKAYQNDFRSLRDALIGWANSTYPAQPITNLKDVAKAVNNAAFTAQIEVLLAQLYGLKKSGSWNPKVFADIFNKQVKTKKNTRVQNQPLPPLYK